jgi:hypothetical protein
MMLTGFFVNGPYALITTAVSADLGTHESLQGNSKALATVTAIIDGMGSVGAAIGPVMTGYISDVGGFDLVFAMLYFSAIAAGMLIIKLAAKEVGGALGGGPAGGPPPAPLPAKSASQDCCGAVGCVGKSPAISCGCATPDAPPAPPTCLLRSSKHCGGACSGQSGAHRASSCTTAAPSPDTAALEHTAYSGGGS